MAKSSPKKASGPVIVLTRSRQDNNVMADLVKKAGGKPFLLPMLADQAVAISKTQLKNITVNDWDWLVFTSRRAAVFFFKQCPEFKLRVAQEKIKIAVVGQETARVVRKLKLRVSFVASGSAKSLVNSPQFSSSTKLKILVPQAADAREELQQAWQAKHDAHFVTVYKKTTPTADVKTWQRLFRTHPGWLTFFSPSAVKAFFRKPRAGQLPKLGWKIAAIGETTAESLDVLGYKSNFVSDLPIASRLFRRILLFTQKQ